MVHHYKLTYFLSRGLADVSRQLFHLAGVEFEDERLTKEQFLEHRDTFPFRQVPVLTVDDGVQIPQSMAIARYLARKFGFAGKNAEEEALVDAFADQFKDFYSEIHDYYYTMLGLGYTNLDGEEQKEKVLVPARDKFLPLLTKYLEKSESGFLVDGGLAYCDLIIVDNMTTLLNWWPDYAKDYPVILEWRDRVMNYPKLKDFIQQRPVTVF